MSDDDRARILQMVAEGRLSPEEAADLLEAVVTEPDEGPNPPPFTPRASRIPSPTMRGRRRSLVIHIKEGGDNKVNIRIPLSLARVAEKFVPRQAQAYLQRYEIDLQTFLDDVSEAEGGTLLEIKEGENRVLIAVES